MDATGFHPAGITWPKPRYHLDEFLSGSPGKKYFFSKIIKDIGRIQFFVGVRLGVPFLDVCQTGHGAGGTLNP